MRLPYPQRSQPLSGTSNIYLNSLNHTGSLGTSATAGFTWNSSVSSGADANGFLTKMIILPHRRSQRRSLQQPESIPGNPVRRRAVLAATMSVAGIKQAKAFHHGSTAISFLGIGDSIMEGDGLAPGQDMLTQAALILAQTHTVVFANGAVGGATAASFAPGQAAYNTALAAGAALVPPANICVYALGVNDAHGETVAFYLAGVRATVDDLVSRGYRVIILDIEYANGNGYVPPMNAALAKLNNGTTIRYIPNLWAWSSVNQNPKYFQDNLHPTAAGAAVYGRFVAADVLAVL